MNNVIIMLRDGTWLSPARIKRLATVTMACTILFLMFLILTAHGLNDYSDRPLGTDFSSFYAAGRLIRLGANPYDQASLHAMQQTIFGAGTPYYAFAYPPLFLLIAWPLAQFPYLLSLTLWQAATFLLYLWSMTLLRRRFGRKLPQTLFYLVVVSFTAVFVNVTHGQNAFLTAALFAAALALLDTRPWLAGLCFGLAAYKPQLGLLIPFALAAGGQWRSFAAAATTILVLAAGCVLLFGTQIWTEFFAAAGLSRQVILESGGVGYAKMVSVFAWLMLWRLPLKAAYAGQAIATLLVIAGTVRLWRSQANPRLHGAGLCVGTLLVTPFALDYDLMLLAPAIMLLAAHEMEDRTIPFGATLLFLLWLTPFFARSIATTTGVPLASWILVMCFLAILKQARA